MSQTIAIISERTTFIYYCSPFVNIGKEIYTPVSSFFLPIPDFVSENMRMLMKINVALYYTVFMLQRVKVSCSF